jgi:alkyl hydroperoxide reductase subunit AhpF
MINYTWDCKTVDVYPQEGDLENVVYNVHWRLTGEDSETAYIGTCIGTQLLNTKDIETFVPIDQLTNEVITGWVKATMGEESVEMLEKNVADQINEQANPTSVTMTIED